MTRLDLTLRLARESGRSAAEAADVLDEAVQTILKSAQARGPLCATNKDAQARLPLCATNKDAQARLPLCATNKDAQARGPLCAIIKSPQASTRVARPKGNSTNKPHKRPDGKSAKAAKPDRP
jgi:hypothetical protein